MKQAISQHRPRSPWELLLAVAVLILVLGALFLSTRANQDVEPTAEAPSGAAQENSPVDQAGRGTDLDPQQIDAPNSRLRSDEEASGFEDQQRRDPAAPIKKAFSYQQPIITALEEAALNRLLTYEQMMSNLATWQPMCAKINGFGNHLAGIDFEGEDDALKRDLEAFCEDFTEKQEEHIDESIEVTSGEGGPEPIQRLRDDPLNRSDPQLGVQAATRALVDALNRYDYATVIEVIWYMGIELPISVDSTADSSPLAYVSGEPEVLFAVGAATFCTEIGTCHGEHPIPIGLCFMFQERPCNNNIRGIDDAINQVLTGAELDQFVAMYDWLQGLIAHHRAGEF